MHVKLRTIVKWFCYIAILEFIIFYPAFTISYHIQVQRGDVLQNYTVYRVIFASSFFDDICFQKVLQWFQFVSKQIKTTLLNSFYRRSQILHCQWIALVLKYGIFTVTIDKRIFCVKSIFLWQGITRKNKLLMNTFPYPVNKII